jgi:hypothetical protein
MDSNEGVAFEPAEGWTLESLVVSNNNPDGCVGRANVDITLSKPASSAMACSTRGDKCIGFKTNDQICAAATEPERRAYFDALLANLELPGDWALNAIAVNGVTSQGYPWANCVAAWTLTGTAVTCACATLTPAALAIAAHAPPLEFSTAAARDAAYAAEVAAMTSALNGLIGLQIEYWCDNAYGNCHYILTVSGLRYPTFSKCSKYQAPNYLLCSSRLRYVIVDFSIECVCDPCEMADYDWPTTMDCGCTGEYTPNTPISTEPVCALELEETSREHDPVNDLCLFKATYLGRVDAGTVDCNAEPTDPDCICCGEN